jgi:hypothetical protein
MIAVNNQQGPGEQAVFRVKATVGGKNRDQACLSHKFQSTPD